MTNETKNYISKFVRLAKQNEFSYNAVFAMGAFAFDKGTSEDDSIERLKTLIEFAQKYKDEKKFLYEVRKAYTE